MKYYFTFSEAIRDGAQLRPQGFWSLLSDDKTCALAAGYEALGLLGTERPAARMLEMYPYMAEVRECPACLTPAMPMIHVVRHLNDLHCWLREDIAMWLETEEEKLGYITLCESVESESLTLETVGVGLVSDLRKETHVTNYQVNRPNYCGAIGDLYLFPAWGRQDHLSFHFRETFAAGL